MMLLLGQGQTAQGKEEVRALKRSRHTLGRHSPAGCSLAWRKGKGSARRPAEHADGPARVRAQALAEGTVQARLPASLLKILA